MTKDEIISKKKEYVFDCVATFYNDPVVIDHAKGQFVCDVQGKQYLDFFGGILSVSVGHANPRVTDKIKEQIDKVQHTSTAHLSEAMVVLAEKMAQIAPGRLKKSYFTNSGSEANEVAVISARMYTGNQEVLALRHGYSGHTQLTKAMTGMKWFGIEHWEVEPDIMTGAKGMANGEPIGWTITRPEIADSYKGLTVSTFGGNPVSCVAAKATVDLIEEDRLMDNAAVVGASLREGLEGLKEKHASIGDVRGMGLMQAIELVKDRKTKE